VSGRIAFVLAGGAARGAYEVGVLSYVYDRVARELGRSPPLDIACGTSVGAINACALAASADDPATGVARLVREWTNIRLPALVRANKREILGLVASLVTVRPKKIRPGQTREGGILDPAGIEKIVHDAIDFSRIRTHLRSGRLHALSLSTTDVTTGRTVIFLERSDTGIPRWSRDPTIVVRTATIRAEHALASAAVPFLFPAVRIDDAFYCDGGLRQNVPLSPARRLGADGLLVVNPRFVEDTTHAHTASDVPYPGPFFLAGKALNALLLDRIDNDIARLRRINDILQAGTRRFGPSFVQLLNEELGTARRVSEMRPLRIVHVRASRDIGAAAGEYVRTREFAERAGPIAGRIVRRIAEWEGEREADLTSYLLFDGAFAARLIELGRRDAAERHDDLCALFEPRMRAAAE
jgi:NTE family protein